MLTFEDCLGLCKLTEEEVLAIAEHEHITETAALELGQYLVETHEGGRMIKRMIVDDMEDAKRGGDEARYLCLETALRHFVDSHPGNRPAEQ